MAWKKLMSEKVPDGKIVKEVYLEVNDETKERRLGVVLEDAPDNKGKPKDDDKGGDWRTYETVPGAGF